MSAFENAAVEVKSLNSAPTNDEKLELYALYKVGTGADFSAAPQPGAFSFEAKYKYNAWKKLVDEGVTAEQAQERYIKLVEELKQKYGFSG